MSLRPSARYDEPRTLLADEVERWLARRAGHRLSGAHNPPERVHGLGENRTAVTAAAAASLVRRTVARACCLAAK